MKKIVTKILSVMLLAVTVFCIGCSGNKKDEVVTIYNKTNYIVDCIALAPESDVLNSKDKIILFDSENIHAPMYAEDYKIKVPMSLLEKDWYLYVSGAKKGFLEMYISETAIGDIFNNDTYGFQLEFDSEAENFVIVPLSGV